MSGEQAFAPRELIDDLVPEGFDWEELVRQYPLPALALAFIGGFVLGRSRGEAVLGALSGFAAGEVARQVNQTLGEDVL
jgi:hypothetical protein